MRSLVISILIGILLIGTRLYYSPLNPDNPKALPEIVTTYDALGYYMYLPAIFIYQDVSKLDWFKSMDEKYQLTGGNYYQANKCENGNYVFKYAGGVAFLQTPFFLAAHMAAPVLGYPADGFSPPYQYALALGVVFWCIGGIFLLRGVLRKFFKDDVVALTLALLFLATNAIQYISAETAMSHGWILPLYVAVLYTTIRWHETPNLKWAFFTGAIVGVATMSRPTEAVMLFIPLLWKMQNSDHLREKWRFLRKNPRFVAAILAGGLIGFLPQMLYWKITTGGFLYSMGSKWVFLNPWFRVLFGWEKGWFIYTPVTILMVAGLLFLRNFTFRKSVITYTLLNLWIIISWSEWQYGASYSTRALVQGYPVMGLALAAAIAYILSKRWRWIIYPLSMALILVNMFQVWQYNQVILHFNDMNRAYYGRIFLNPAPNALDMSMLDTRDWLDTPEKYTSTTICDTVLGTIDADKHQNRVVWENQLSSEKDLVKWLKIEAQITVNQGFDNSFIVLENIDNHVVKQVKLRLFTPVNKPGKSGLYAAWFKVPSNGQFKVSIMTGNIFNGIFERLTVTAYQ